MECIINLKLQVGSFENKTMGLSVINGTEIIFQNPMLSTGINEIKFKIDLPVELKFVTSNRNKNDTKVDANGKIIEDKFINLKNFILDDFYVPDYKISKEYLYIQGDRESNNVFWNRNSTIIFSIDKEDPILWWLSRPELFN